MLNPWISVIDQKNPVHFGVLDFYAIGILLKRIPEKNCSNREKIISQLALCQLYVIFSEKQGLSW